MGFLPAPEVVMRWTPGGLSSDVEDRRSSSGGGGGRLGIVGFVVLLVISLITGRKLPGIVSVGERRLADGFHQRDSTSGLSRGRTLRPACLFCAGRCPGDLDQGAGAGGRGLSACQAGTLPRLHIVRMRRSPERDRAVLLPGR